MAARCPRAHWGLEGTGVHTLARPRTPPAPAAHDSPRTGEWPSRGKSQRPRVTLSQSPQSSPWGSFGRCTSRGPDRWLVTCSHHWLSPWPGSPVPVVCRPLGPTPPASPPAHSLGPPVAGEAVVPDGLLAGVLLQPWLRRDCRQVTPESHHGGDQVPGSGQSSSWGPLGWGREG